MVALIPIAGVTLRRGAVSRGWTTAARIYTSCMMQGVSGCHLFSATPSLQGRDLSLGGESHTLGQLQEVRIAQ